MKNEMAFEILKSHIGHHVRVVSYDDDEGEIYNVSIECEDCNEVLYDLDNPKMK
jgi:hypothetical protein